MRREMVWIEKDDFRGWGCSECEWKFKPSGVPTGKTIDEMKQDTNGSAIASLNRICAATVQARRIKYLSKCKSTSQAPMPIRNIIRDFSDTERV
jgi:hypothetical protein